MAEFIFGSSECLENITTDNVSSYLTYPEAGVKVFETKHFKCCALVNRHTVFKEYNDGFFLILGSCLYKDRPVNNEQIDDICVRLVQNDFDLHKDLSGRYLILTCQNEHAFVINSIFGTFPSYFDGRQNFLCSSNQSILNRLNHFNLNADAIKERVLFYANYSDTLNKDIIVQPSCSIVSFNLEKNNREIFSGLSNAFRKTVKKDNLIDSLISRMEFLIKGYNDYEEKSNFAVPLSGGRDSRFMLSLLNNVLGSNSFCSFTVGEVQDIECAIAKKFTNSIGVKHEVFSPLGIDIDQLAKYISYFENFNFPFQYKIQLIEHLKSKNLSVINTHIPEILFSHLDNFEGDSNPIDNFLRKKISCIHEDDIIDGRKVQECTINNAKKQWKVICSELPENDYLRKNFFELTTYARDWPYRTIRPYDLYGRNVCIMEDVEIISILSHLKKEDILNDQFYEKLMSEKFSYSNSVVPTTRDLTIPKLLADVKSFNISNIIKKLPYLIKPGSLNYLFGKNIDFYRTYINENKDLLEEYFTAEYIETLQSKLKKGWGTNRFTNFIKNRCTKDFLRDYDIIFPVCIIALRKEWERK